ncbi:MAG: hypothetical protein H6721_26280 [Sandaracinus sp.]|nr:hypothetical protein [Sandaracinus sp.]
MRLSEPSLYPWPTELLPARPQLFYFRNERSEDTEIVASAPFRVLRRERFSDLVFEVLQFDVAEGELRVRIGGRPELRYFVSPHWREPVSSEDGGLATPHMHRWICATSKGWMVEPCSEAPAFEIEWDGGHVVLPAAQPYRHRSLWRPHEPSCRRALLVGDHGCDGPVVDVIPDADTFRVFALLPNGQRRPAGVFKRGRRPWEPKRAPPKKRLARRVESPSDLGAPLLVCAAFVALALVCRVRRRRR